MRHQQGASLLELLVGILLGLLVIGAAISTLMVSRATSGTIGDISQLQQQGSYAMRVMGTQFRQAGSIDITSASPARRGAVRAGSRPAWVVSRCAAIRPRAEISAPVSSPKPSSVSTP